MTKDEYMAFHKACCDKMIAVTKAKNADYTGTSDDPFANFSRVENIGICSTEQGFLTRMFDKFSRITSFVQKGVLAVKDESVEDTLIDLANYCILMAGFIRAKKQQSTLMPKIIWPEHVSGGGGAGSGSAGAGFSGVGSSSGVAMKCATDSCGNSGTHFNLNQWWCKHCADAYSSIEGGWDLVRMKQGPIEDLPF